MSDGYTKLFASITDSTIWQEPDATRLVWITMLAMCDQDGYVGASVPGLASRARVPMPACIKALETLKAPDEWSRTEDFEGRRIADADGGWLLLNHAKYRAIRNADERRERARQAMAELRASRKAEEQLLASVSNVSHGYPPLAHTEADTEAVKAKATVRATPAPSRFDEFWLAYPNKKGRKDAERHWKREGCDAVADALLAHVALMQREDADWLRGAIPMGSTYINGRRWEDQPKRDKAATTGAYTTPSPNKGPSETPLEQAVSWARQQHHMGQIDAVERDRLISAATEKHRGKTE